MISVLQVTTVRDTEGLQFDPGLDHTFCYLPQLALDTFIASEVSQLRVKGPDKQRQFLDIKVVS